MLIQSAKIRGWLTAINCLELEEHIEAIEDDEIAGREEMQIFADELSYCIANYREDGHCWHDDLVQARELLKKTKNGTEIPLDNRTLKPKEGYKPFQIEAAKRTIEEYKQMVSRYNYLLKKGYRGQWL